MASHPIQGKSRRSEPALARPTLKGPDRYRVWLFAGLVFFAMVLGGGGSPSAGAEMALQLLFALGMLVWVFLPGQEAANAPKGAVVTCLVVLALPTIQLVPLPPAVWQSLPGRETLVSALSLIGGQDSWRPWTLAPGETLASLLSMVPPVFCLYATSTLPATARRPVMAMIAATIGMAAFLGIMQGIPGNGNLYPYAESSRGWATGFQANRNAAADVFLVGILALAVSLGPLASAGRSPASTRGILGVRSQKLLMIGGGLFFALAAVLTGSRAGIVLLPAVMAGAAFIFLFGGGLAIGRGKIAVAIAAGLTLFVAVAALLYSRRAQSIVGISLSRFEQGVGQREITWSDTLFAIGEYWPSGFGMGGFGHAIVQAESLEFLDRSFPNRAHNDYLEIALEAGVAGPAVLLVVAVLVVHAFWRTTARNGGIAERRQAYFGTGVLLVIALHSIVDYPLRSMAVACLVGISAGLLFAPGKRGGNPPKGPEQAGQKGSIDA